ncbi:hypothetical protein CNEO4_1400001 [Clostridium neonatale]|nr:hypothetical protein CNEO4_160015 [Clostridium neonatale]CAI3594247.1 hypothetical protein CNEO4_1400001 [Clostridium neonatale]CAI3642280.1 hypothetical protein CNEO2_2160001 [Clostridium neonatale]
MAPKAFIIIYYTELGKPYMFLLNKVSNRKERNDIEGRRKG